MTVDYQVTFILREVCPRDFYFFSLVKNDYPDVSALAFNLHLIALFLDDGEEILYEVPASMVQVLAWWIEANLLKEKLMELSDWYELCFHLQKQRWTSATDWMEQQPMSKVLLMMNVQSKFNEEQNAQMKRNAKKR